MFILYYYYNQKTGIELQLVNLKELLKSKKKNISELPFPVLSYFLHISFRKNYLASYSICKLLNSINFLEKGKKFHSALCH